MEIKLYKQLNQYIVKLREDIFVLEQGFSNEFDNIDINCYYLLLWLDNKAIATLRYYYDYNHDCFCIGRVCCDKNYRGNGYTKLLMEKAISNIKEIGVKKICLDAQDKAVGFYSKLGFINTNKTHMDEFCLHYLMELYL